MQFTGFGNSIPDGEQFSQETRVPALTWEGKCLRRRAKPAHLVRHLPVVGGLCRCADKEAEFPPPLPRVALYGLLRDIRIQNIVVVPIDFPDQVGKSTMPFTIGNQFHYLLALSLASDLVPIYIQVIAQDL
jgi:hypothetical protein